MAYCHHDPFKMLFMFSIARVQKYNIGMAEEETKKKKGPPQLVLANKQVFPLLGFGTFRLQDQALIAQLLRKGLQLGYCRHIDTARWYNNEIPLGKAIQTVIREGRVKREELFIASKIFNCKFESAQRQVKEMLQLMQLQYIDLLYIHWPFVDTNESGQFCHKPLDQLWAQLELLVTKGYVKHLGISNFNGQLIMDLLTYCKVKPIALQIELHPYLPNTALAELAQKNGIAVIAFTPLVLGNSLKDVNILKDDVICDIAAKHGRTPAQIVLKSTIQRGIGLLPKTSSMARLQQNFESWTVELSEDDLKKIRALGVRGHRVIGTSGVISKKFSVFD